MTFLFPWGLLGLLALPAIGWIHLYQRRSPPLQVAGLHLWGGAHVVRSAGRRRDRLPLSGSLLLELLAALVLTLAIAQPRLTAWGEVVHLIVVLDNSASMQAVFEGKSGRDRAAEELAARMENLGRRGVVTLIQSGRRPVMVAGPAVPWKEAAKRLESWQPSLARHSLLPALDLAAQLAQAGGRQLLLTDHLPEQVAVPSGMEVAALGRSLDNVRFSAANWATDPKTRAGRLTLRVANAGRSAAHVEIRGDSRGREILRRELEIAAGDDQLLATDLPGGLGELQLHLSAADDALDLDNHLTLIEPSPHVVTVHLALPATNAAALAVQRVLDVLPGVQFGNADEADLVIGPMSVLPESRRGLWWLGIGPLDRSGADPDPAQTSQPPPAGATVDPATEPFLIEKRNPLMDGVLLGGVHWTGVSPMTLDAAPLISAGRHRLLSQLNGTRTAAYLLNIDLAASNLTETPDWPILISNFVERCRETRPGLSRWNYRLGESAAFRLAPPSPDAAGTSQTAGANSTAPAHPSGQPDDGDVLDVDERPPDNHNPLADLELVSPDGRRRLARGDVVETPPLHRPGVYEIVDRGQPIARFAVNFFDPLESDLKPLNSGRRQPETDVEREKIRRDDLHSWWVIAGILVALGLLIWNWARLR